MRNSNVIGVENLIWRIVRTNVKTRKESGFSCDGSITVELEGWTSGLSRVGEEVFLSAEQTTALRKELIDRITAPSVKAPYTSSYTDYRKISTTRKPMIKKVVFNDPATIAFWSDGTKTVVKAREEEFDKEKGLAMAIAKKFLGNEGNYFEEFKKWCW